MEDFLKAGKVAGEALRKGSKMIKPGAKLLDVAETVEKYIKDNADGCSFPCNISIDNQAAHYTPCINDEKVFGEKDVVKLDCGSQVNGFIGDTAMTIDLSGEYGKLVEASEKALENVIAMVKPGVNAADLGAEVEKTITGMGFNPIRNLSGHVMEQWELHTGYNIPNYDASSGVELEEGMRIAIEPFASTGRGIVANDREIQIFSLNQIKPVRNSNARKVIEFAQKEFRTLPFAERWLSPVCSEFGLKIALREIVEKEIFNTYPILKDDGIVSQREHTVLVTKDGCIVTTE